MTRILSSLAEGIGQTITITAGAFALGAVLGFPLALMRRSPYRVLRAPAIAVIEVLRAIPPIVWLFIVYYGIGTDVVRLSTFAGAVLGLGLIASAHLAEIYRAGIGAVARGQWEAATALGLPRRAVYQRVVLPQALVVVVPPAATFAIGLLKDSAIASVIGATDITFRAVQETQANLQGLTVFAVAGLLYIALSLPIAALARYTDRILARKAAA
jgi:polar amino acid transport system permease protein